MHTITVAQAMTDASLNFVESLYFCNVYVKSIPGIFNILVNKLSSHMMYAASYMYMIAH